MVLKRQKQPMADAAADHSETEGGFELELRTPPDDGITRRWYAIHVHTGQELSVCRNLLNKAKELDNPDLITNVFVPMERVNEVREGRKRAVQRKYCPGYVLAQLPENPQQYPELWRAIHEVSGITGFVGTSRNKPVPAEDAEVESLIQVMRGEKEAPRPKIDIEPGTKVRIIEGPFANFVGTVAEINPERGIVKVQVEIFERFTSVEVELWQIEQI